MKQKQNHYWVIDTPEKAKRAYEILTKAGESVGENTLIELEHGKSIFRYLYTKDGVWTLGIVRPKMRSESTLDELSDMLGVGDETNGAPLFKSWDNENLNEGDNYFMAFQEEWKGEWTISECFRLDQTSLVNTIPDRAKAFKSREKAERWVKKMNGKKDNDHWSVDTVVPSPVPYSPTRLEYFAGLALQGLLAGSFDQPIKPSLINEAIENTSKWATAYARSLITELDKGEQK